MGNKNSTINGQNKDQQGATAVAHPSDHSSSENSHPNNTNTVQQHPNQAHMQQQQTAVLHPSQQQNKQQQQQQQPGPNNNNNQIQTGLDEFTSAPQVQDNNVTAQDSYSHWDDQLSRKNKETGSTTDVIGAENKIRNKTLHNTMRQTLRQTMCNGDLRQLVKLPANADLNEWLALYTIHFYRTCSIIGQSYSELCTATSCPLMSAGNVEYLWKDNHQYPKPTRVPASLYIEFSLHEALKTIEDTSIFPLDDTQPFPPNFISKIREIFKRLFRQFAHLYYSHYEQIKHNGSSKHLNSTFKHFVHFVLEFNLLDSATLQPLQKFIDHIMAQHNTTTTSGNNTSTSQNKGDDATSSTSPPTTNDNGTTVSVK